MSSAIEDRVPLAREKRLLLERVTESPVLHGSEALCNLLRYLAGHALEAPNHPPKEHQIATEVFGRSEEFDPRIDSTVRVQTSRLRAKLAEYYAGLGAADPWQIEIPKGSYGLVFHERHVNAPPPVVEAVLPMPPPSPSNRALWVSAITSIAAIAALIVVLFRVPAHSLSPAPEMDRRLLQFWTAALSRPQEPVVIFSNAEFVGRPETGLRYATPSEIGHGNTFDHYTGVGEVVAIHDLDHVFQQMRRSFVLRRSGLLNWDDARDRDLIFVGSPSENLALTELPLNRHFMFEPAMEPPRAGDLGIRNVRPLPGEPAWFFGSTGLPIVQDYALVELTSSTPDSRRVLLLAGTTTFGTQAAVEFVSNPDKISELQSRLGADAFAANRHFSAVLRVSVRRGVPLDSQIVTVRKD